MKYTLIGLLLILPFLLTCNISSPYIDVLTEKIEKDWSGTTTAPAGNILAQAIAYDSDTNLGTIQLTWDTTVPASDQNEAVFLYIRGKTAEQPQDTADGFEVYHGDLSINNISIDNIALGDRYHFGIWAQDQYGKLSEPVYAQASIQADTLEAVSDLHYENGTPSVNVIHPELYLGHLDGFNYSIHILFDDLTFSNVLRADLRLFTTEAGTTGNIEIFTLNESWSGSDDAATLSGKSATLYTDIFTDISVSTWTKWDITGMVQNWEQNSNYGIRITDSSSAEAARFRSSENVGDLTPKIDIYYHY